MLDWRVQVDTEKHLTLVLVREEEESDDGLERDLVIERLPVEVDEGGEQPDVVPTPGGEGGDLLKGADIITGVGRANIRLVSYVV